MELVKTRRLAAMHKQQRTKAGAKKAPRPSEHRVRSGVKRARRLPASMTVDF